jgi:hypothetical protein
VSVDRTFLWRSRYESWCIGGDFGYVGWAFGPWLGLECRLVEPKLRQQFSAHGTFTESEILSEVEHFCLAR